MRLLPILCTLAVSAFLHHSVLAAALSVDDFSPPIAAATPEAQAEATSVAKPNAVKEVAGFGGKTAIEASTAQDAVNAAAQQIEAAGGCEQIKFPSGFGWVSTGLGVYAPTSNPTATLLAQRQAYQVAYLNAKKNLAEALYGLSTEGQEQLNQEFKTVISDTDNLTNMADTLRENIQEQVKGLLRGFVVYNIDDKQDKHAGAVSVTIVATPKTMGKTQRLSADAVTADSIKDGLNLVLTEIGNGLMPPVGGKIVNVPQTGEIAFAGFGSAVVVPNPNPAVQAKLTLQAQKLAAMRARSALCGIIVGTDLQAQTTLDNQTQALSNQFKELQKDDPLNKTSSQEGVAKLNEQKNSFINTQLSKEQIASVTKGVLPPGVTVKTFFNPEKTIAEAVAIYLPSVSAGAAAAGQDMKNSQILPSGGNGGAGQFQKAMPNQGPSGQVTNAADL